MDIKQFKKALREGEVKFTYTKKDGTKREARGTLNEKLTPPSENKIKFKCFDINWDTDGNDNADLPSKVMLEFDKTWFDKVSKTETGTDIDDIIANELSDKYGFCLLDFCYERVEPKKLAEGTVFYYDLDKAGYRSFNESQLTDWKNN